MDYLNWWKEVGGSLICIFSSMGEPSKWGSWGILENYHDEPMTRPKYAATQQFNECNPPWWEDTTSPVVQPIGLLVVNFRGDSVPVDIAPVRAFADDSTGGELTGHIIPFNIDSGNYLFSSSGYSQDEFYGGVHLDYSPLPTAGVNRYEIRTLDAGYAPNQFIVEMGAGENEPSSLCLLYTSPSPRD